jgi:hypothetical protein
MIVGTDNEGHVRHWSNWYAYCEYWDRCERERIEAERRERLSNLRRLLLPPVPEDWHKQLVYVGNLDDHFEVIMGPSFDRTRYSDVVFAGSGDNPQTQVEVFVALLDWIEKRQDGRLDARYERLFPRAVEMWRGRHVYVRAVASDFTGQAPKRKLLDPPEGFVYVGMGDDPRTRIKVLVMLLDWVKEHRPDWRWDDDRFIVVTPRKTRRVR